MADLLNMAASLNSNPRGSGRRKTNHKRRKVEDDNKLTDDVFQSPSYDENSGTEKFDHPNVETPAPVEAPVRYRYTIQDKLNAVKIFNAHKEEGISLKATSLELGVSAPLLSFWIENQQELERIENPSTSTRKPTAKYTREFKDHAIATYEAKKAKFSKKAISKELGISAPLLNTWIVKPRPAMVLPVVVVSPAAVTELANGEAGGDSVGDGVIIEAAAAATACANSPLGDNTTVVSDDAPSSAPAHKKTEPRADTGAETQAPRRQMTKQRKPTTSYSDEFKLGAVQEFWERKTRCPQMSKASIAKDLGVSAPLLNTWIKNADRGHFSEGTFGDTIGIV